jgi:WD40 repeat protein/tetratricopeptide (TPR) repeat protein
VGAAGSPGRPLSRDVNTEPSTSIEPAPIEDEPHFVPQKIGLGSRIIRFLDAYLMGYDVFVSYSWRGSRKYAEKLVAALQANRYRCFLDSSDYQAGSDLNRDAQRAVRLSSSAAIVVTPVSLRSHHVRYEIELFNNSDKPLVPIDVNQTLYVRGLRADGVEEWTQSPAVTEILASASGAEGAAILTTLDHISRDKRIQICESQTDEPSQATVDALCKRFSFSRRVTRRLRVISAACLVLVLLTGIAGWLWSVATYQKGVAEDRFARISVANGERLLAQEDLPGALVWFANPLSVHPRDEEIHRQRIAAIADSFPSLVSVLPHPTTVKEMRLSEEGSTLGTVGYDGSLRVWDIRMGVSSTPPIVERAKEIKAATFSANAKMIAVIVPKPATDEEFAEFLRKAEKETGEDIPETYPKTRAEMKTFFETMDPQSEARAYETASGKLVGTLTTRGGERPAMWASPNGTFVIAGSASIPMGGKLSSLTTIWQPGNPGSSTPIPEAEFSMVSFSPDGKTLLGGEYNGTWRLVSSEGVILQTGHTTMTGEDSLDEIALSPTGLQFATATRAGRVTLWDTRTGQAVIEELDPGKGGNRDLHALAFSPDGRWLAGAIGFLGEKMVHVWDTQSGKLFLNIELTEPGHSVSFSPSGRYLLFTTQKEGSFEGEARVWDIGTGLPATPKIGSVYLAQWGPDPDTIITAGSDKTVKVWELFHQTGTVLSLGQQELLRNGRLSRDGQVLAANAEGGFQTYNLDWFDHWDFSFHKLGSSWEHREFTLNDDRSIGVLAGRNESSAYDLKNRGRFPDFLHKDGDGWVEMAHVTSVEISSDGHTTLLAGGNMSDNVNTGRVLTWDARTGQALPGRLAHDAFVTHATFSPDGRSIVSTSRDGTARIWDVASGQLRRRLEHGSPVTHATFSNDSKVVATASLDGFARLWKVETGEVMGKPMWHEGSVEFVSFSPDGSSLLTISKMSDAETSVARLWDAVTREAKGAPARLGRMQGGSKAGFIPDGRYIITPYAESGFRVWSTATMEGVTPKLDNGWHRLEKGFLARPRSLVVSQDTKGRPLLFGIGAVNARASHAVVPWSLPADLRPAEELISELEMIASRHIDSTSALVLLTPDEIKARWEKIPNRGKRRHESPAEWFRREAEECLELREWSGVVWNIDRFLKLQPGSATAALELDKGRALAELERWSESAESFERARALGASDANTLPHLARLWIASGNAPRQQEIAGLLVNEARKTNVMSDRLDLLRAAVIGPLPMTAPDQKAALEMVQEPLQKTDQPDENASARDVLATILYRSGDFNGALAQLDQLKKDNWSRKNSLHLFAMTKWQLGDRAGAAKDLAEAQEAMKRFAGIRRYEDGLHASSLYWYEWTELCALDAEASKLIQP